MTIDKQIELKKKANRDAKYNKNWRELEDKMNTHSPRDFKLGERGWKCDKTTVWWED